MKPTCPILLITNNLKVARNLRLLSRTTTNVVKNIADMLTLEAEILSIIKKRQLAQEGDVIILSSGDKEIKTDSTNMMKVLKV
jgi:pyruvate kinase